MNWDTAIIVVIIFFTLLAAPSFIFSIWFIVWVWRKLKQEEKDVHLD